MTFSNLNETEWSIFLQWAELEGWRVSFQEQRLFQNQWRPYFFVLYTDGLLRGFVSAVAYKESGWIGNLLVPRDQRGKGYGSVLFDYALQFLCRNRPKRVWLTASETGKPIYQRRGFRVADRVDRWITQGQGIEEALTDQPIAELVDLDTRCWGESRSPLLNYLSDDSDICHCGKAWGLLQTGISEWQLGPWLSVDKNVTENRQLLEQAIKKVSVGKELLVDVLASSEMDFMLKKLGFKKITSNQLMVLSDQIVDLKGVVALASLGSIG